jgi:hypothetical protein
MVARDPLLDRSGQRRKAEYEGRKETGLKATEKGKRLRRSVEEKVMRSSNVKT